MLISGLYPDLERGEASIVLNYYEEKQICVYIAIQNTQTQIFIDLIAEEEMTKNYIELIIFVFYILIED